MTEISMIPLQLLVERGSLPLPLSMGMIMATLTEDGLASSARILFKIMAKPCFQERATVNKMPR